MAEWLKILLSALAGMTTAALLEPLKHWIARRTSARGVQRAVYREIATAYNLLKNEICSDGLDAVMRRLVVETLDFYWTSKRDALYEVPNYTVLVGVIGKLKDVKEAYKTDKAEANVTIKHWIELVEMLIISGVIDDKVFGKELNRASTFKENAAKRGARLIREAADRKNKKMPSIR